MFLLKLDSSMVLYFFFFVLVFCTVFLLQFAYQDKTLSSACDRINSPLHMPVHMPRDPRVEDQKVWGSIPTALHV